MPLLTIITASHRNPEGLASLHEQILPALGTDIVWLIKDSGACQKSAAWGTDVSSSCIRFVGSPDTGIYSALNQALALCDSEFYLVAGCDDTLYSSALISIVEMIRSGDFADLDVASFPIMTGGRVRGRMRIRPLFVSVGGLVSSHSVGTVLRRRLHESVGYYCDRYLILADALFIRRAYQSGARFRQFDGPITGIFSTEGISSTHHARRIMEAYSYNVECGDSVPLQAVMMLIRTLKHKPLSFFV